MGKKLMLLTLLFSAKMVSAQQDTTTLDEVVVTANKMAQKQSNTGKVVTVITKSDLEKMISFVDKLNEKFGNWEKIKRFELTPDLWSIEGGHLTPTLKLKRKVVMEKYLDLFNKIYN